MSHNGVMETTTATTYQVTYTNTTTGETATGPTHTTEAAAHWEAGLHNYTDHTARHTVTATVTEVTE